MHSFNDRKNYWFSIEVILTISWYINSSRTQKWPWSFLRNFQLNEFSKVSLDYHFWKQCPHMVINAGVFSLILAAAHDTSTNGKNVFSSRVFHLYWQCLAVLVRSLIWGLSLWGNQRHHQICDPKTEAATTDSKFEQDGLQYSNTQGFLSWIIWMKLPFTFSVGFFVLSTTHGLRTFMFPRNTIIDRSSYRKKVVHGNIKEWRVTLKKNREKLLDKWFVMKFFPIWQLCNGSWSLFQAELQLMLHKFRSRCSLRPLVFFRTLV